MKKIERIVFLLAGLLFTGLFIFQHQVLYALLFLLFLLAVCLAFLRQETSHTREMVQISRVLECLLQKKKFESIRTSKETLASKIQFQILRIEEIHQGYQATILSERDNMKQFLAQITHQLRTPLMNLQLHLAFLDNSSSDDETREIHLLGIKQAEEKIEFLVERFILSSRMESQLIQIHKTETNLKETIAKAMFQVQKNADEKHISIKLVEKTAGIQKVPHDQNWLLEAIDNLLDNSIKYSPFAGPITITLQDNNMFTEICVEDAGIGIEPGEENKIFQLYYRGNLVAKESGYGIGLFLTREIIKKHDGFLRVKRKTHGLAMSIFLPK